MKALIGIDGSEGSFQATRFAGALLTPGRDEICFYYSPPGVSLRSTVPVDPSIIERTRNALSSAVFAAATECLPAELRTKVSLVVGKQPPHQGVALAAEQERADLIVVGAAGANISRRFGIGSVGRAVVHRTHLPVLIVRERVNHVPNAPQRVLLACDESPASRQAAELLNQFHWPAGTEGYVLSVLESVLEGQIPAWLEAEARKQDADASSRAWIQHHDDQKRARVATMTSLCQHGLPKIFGIHPPQILEGHPSRLILKTIDELAIDLVVVGARGLHFWDRLLLGSTSENLIAHAPCSLLVVCQKHDA